MVMDRSITDSNALRTCARCPIIGGTEVWDDLDWITAYHERRNWMEVEYLAEKRKAFLDSMG